MEGGRRATERTHSAAGRCLRVRASRPVSVATVLASDCLAFAVAVAVGGAAHWWVWLALGVVLIALAVRGRYRPRIALSVTHEITSIVGCVVAPLGLLGLLIERSSTSTALVKTGAIAVGLLVVGRITAYALVRSMRRRRMLVEPTLILGAGGMGQELARTLLDHPEYGLEPVGFPDEFDDAARLRVIRAIGELEMVLKARDIRRVIIAFGGTRERDMVHVVRSCRHAVDIHVVPRFFELGLEAARRDIDVVWGIPLLRLRQAAPRTGAWQVRQALGVALAAIGLLVLSPVYGLVALAVWLSSPGPILFRQCRIGQDGKPFDMLKFRTMRVNQDSNTTWTVKSDQRVTSVGRVLRVTALDELPQLINVVRGDMALVGPRPERPHFADRFGANVDGYQDRMRVPAGVTGWAQVNGLRGDTSIEQRARFDNQYIENWSLWEDAVILVRTVGEILRTVLQAVRDGVRPVRSIARKLVTSRPDRSVTTANDEPATGSEPGLASQKGELVGRTRHR